MGPGNRESQRVLVVRLDIAGDVLLAGPAVRAVTGSEPGRAAGRATRPTGGAAARR